VRKGAYFDGVRKGAHFDGVRKGAYFDGVRKGAHFDGVRKGAHFREENMPATISLGDTGDDVKRLQRVLARMLQWIPFGPINGIFDATLQTSVEGFQAEYGLTVDGIVGPATWAKLPSYREASPTLKQGDTGPVVAWLQQTLAGSVVKVFFAPYTGPIDGIFGPDTDAAVRALQTWSAGTVDGVVRDDTWFTWLTPGTVEQLSLEGACGLLDRLP
jgi:peptidoglycan hydrolase-like protein with peptidoglycan-binding domain